MLRQMIAPHLASIRLSTTLHVPGTWMERGAGTETADGGTRVTYSVPHIVAAAATAPAPGMEAHVPLPRIKPFRHQGDANPRDPRRATQDPSAPSQGGAK